jgi:hypothetical protein
MNRATLSDVGTIRGRKSLDDERNAKARTFVAGVVEQSFAGHQSNAATAFGVKQGTLSAFLSGNAGIGPALAEGVANYAGVSLDVVFGRVPPSGDPHPHKTAVMRDPEFIGADPEVQKAFGSLRGHGGRGDKSISEWLDDLRGMVRLHGLGMLHESYGGRRDPDNG